MWLFTIAAHVLANHRRPGRRRLALASRLRDQMASTPVQPDLGEQTAVRDAVLHLRDAHRELIMLIHWDGFNVVEAAEMLGRTQPIHGSRQIRGGANGTSRGTRRRHLLLSTKRSRPERAARRNIRTCWDPGGPSRSTIGYR